MEQTKHTPGPYAVVKYGNNKWEVQGPIAPIKSRRDKPVTTLTGRIAIFDRKADADLFAAAPELLEGCKRALNVMDSDPACAIYKAHRELIAAAIALVGCPVACNKVDE